MNSRPFSPTHTWPVQPEVGSISASQNGVCGVLHPPTRKALGLCCAEVLAFTQLSAGTTNTVNVTGKYPWAEPGALSGGGRSKRHRGRCAAPIGEPPDAGWQIVCTVDHRLALSSPALLRAQIL
jgi:hypothetical protein